MRAGLGVLETNRGSVKNAKNIIKIKSWNQNFGFAESIFSEILRNVSGPSGIWCGSVQNLQLNIQNWDQFIKHFVPQKMFLCKCTVKFSVLAAEARLRRASSARPGVCKAGPPLPEGCLKFTRQTCSAKSAPASDPPRGCRPCTSAPPSPASHRNTSFF